MSIEIKRVFYFWNNGRIYKGDKPVLDIPIAEEPIAVDEYDPLVISRVILEHSMRLQAVAVSYFDEEIKQRIFVLNIPDRPEIRFSGNFPFSTEIENRLIGLIAEIVSNKTGLYPTSDGPDMEGEE